uniref:hypothetical protein n=1 Tax=uncultured Vibrio sp. TaxID=114054 RepID=UPI002609FDEB
YYTYEDDYYTYEDDYYTYEDDYYTYEDDYYTYDFTKKEWDNGLQDETDSISSSINSSLYDEALIIEEDEEDELLNLPQNSVGIKNITGINRTHGVCGFCSALGAMYKDYDLKRSIDNSLSADTFTPRMMAEIKAFLLLLKFERVDLVSEIESFTRNFSFDDDYSSFSIDGYLESINSIRFPSKDVHEVDDITINLSFALPPSALLFYIKEIANFRQSFISTEDQLISNGTNGVIVGFGDKRKKDERWNGLAHWVYCKSEYQCYNYGEEVSLEGVKRSVAVMLNTSIRNVYFVAQIIPIP